MKIKKQILISIIILTIVGACSPKSEQTVIDILLNKYTDFTLTTDVSSLTENDDPTSY